MKIFYLVFLITLLISSLNAKEKKLAYLVSDIRIPFWEIMSRGIKNKANELGYKVDIYSANNLKKKELENIVDAISTKVDGLILSPINSSTAVTVLKLAKEVNLPVVISDIGADSGSYVSYISADNETGSYEIGKFLAKKMAELGWDKNGTVGIVSIPQKRENGKVRTKGFMKAMTEAGIRASGIKQQVNFSYKETYDFSKELIEKNRNLRALWLQGSDRYKGALDAIRDSGKTGEILLICFDAEPIFLDLIPKGILLGSAMQQPFLMGQKAVISLDRYLHGFIVNKEEKLPILAISQENIEEKLPIIKRNVLGIIEE